MTREEVTNRDTPKTFAGPLSQVMVKHIVLFKFKPTSCTKDILRLAQSLEKLEGKIPGILDYVWGSSVSPERKEKGYTHGFIMTFESKKLRDEYLTHPAHLECVAKYVVPIYEDILVFDIEC